MVAENTPITATNSDVAFVLFGAVYRDTWNLGIAIPIGVMIVYAQYSHIFGSNLGVVERNSNCANIWVNYTCFKYGGPLAWMRTR